MGFVFFDVETTGLQKGFDQIVHFAAIRTDNDLNETDRFEARCRLMPHVVPHPLAITTNGLPISRLTDSALPTHYEMMRAVRAKLLDWTPSLVVGFNSIRFDEEMIRHALFQTLHDPYLTSRNNNCRGDALGLVMAAVADTPQCLIVPIGPEGRPTFRLEALAAANGLDHSMAHDALGDVRATLALARLVKDGAPEVWQRFVRFSNKASVSQFVAAEDGFLLTEFYGNEPYPAVVVVIGADPEQPANGRLCLRLDANLDVLLALPDDALRAALSEKDGPVRRLRTNAGPVLTPLYDAPDALLGGRSVDDLEVLARRIKEDSVLCARVVAAWSASRVPYARSPYPERRTHDGFPGQSDELRRDDFHDAGWSEAVRIVEQFDDDRLRAFGLRLIYLGNRACLPEALATETERALTDRLMCEDAGGLTLAAALAETDKLLLMAIADRHRELLSEFRGWLVDRIGRVTAFRERRLQPHT